MLSNVYLPNVLKHIDNNIVYGYMQILQCSTISYVDKYSIKTACAIAKFKVNILEMNWPCELGAFDGIGTVVFTCVYRFFAYEFYKFSTKIYLKKLVRWGELGPRSQTIDILCNSKRPRAETIPFHSNLYKYGFGAPTLM